MFVDTYEGVGLGSTLKVSNHRSLKNLIGLECKVDFLQDLSGTQGHFYDGLYDDVKNDDVFSTTSINDDGNFRRQTIRRRVLFDDRLFDDGYFSTTLIIRRPTFRRR